AGSRSHPWGGENGTIGAGHPRAAPSVGWVTLNGPPHPLARPLATTRPPSQRFKGTFPGRMALSNDGRHLFVVDQGAFEVDVIDTSLIQTGTDTAGRILQPDNFAAGGPPPPAGPDTVRPWPFRPRQRPVPPHDRSLPLTPT